MKDISYRVALGGIVSALCLVCMFMAGIMPALYIVLPMFAGVLLMIIAAEVSISWAVLTYIAVSLLSLIICADKEASLLFIMLFGHYPLLRLYIQRIRRKTLRFIIKLIVFNTCLISYYHVTVVILGIPSIDESFGDFGRAGIIAALVVCNIILFFQDFNLGHLHTYYLKKLRPFFKRKR